MPFPEVPTLAEASVVRHPQSGRECLLATTESGRHIAFGFEVDSDRPGLEIVDPRLWLTADAGERMRAVEEPEADDWLQALITHPVAAAWLGTIKREHPDAYHHWFAQNEYDEGGEEGAG